MRMLGLAVLLVAMAVGCGGKKPKSPADASFDGAYTNRTPGGATLIVTPDDSPVGKVAWVNPGARFVVLNFPVGHLPPKDQRFNLYRKGFKVGEVRISGPQHDDNVVADLVAGDSAVGDIARKD